MCKIQCGDGLYRVGEYCYYAADDKVPGCKEGTEPGVCSKCPEGYGTPSCAKCSGIKYSNGTIPCTDIPNCETAVDNKSMKCSKCKNGYIIGSNQECVACGTGYSSDGKSRCVLNSGQAALTTIANNIVENVCSKKDICDG